MDAETPVLDFGKAEVFEAEAIDPNVAVAEADTGERLDDRTAPQSDCLGAHVRRSLSEAVSMGIHIF